MLITLHVSIFLFVSVVNFLTRDADDEVEEEEEEEEEKKQKVDDILREKLLKIEYDDMLLQFEIVGNNVSRQIYLIGFQVVRKVGQSGGMEVCAK